MHTATASTAPTVRLFCLPLLLLSLVFGFSTHIYAQYTDPQLQALRPTVSEVGEATRAQYPAAWRSAHNGGEPSGSEFVRRWALALRDRGITACVNGKRGTNTLSQDVLVFPVTEGGAQDTSGRYDQIAIVDVIVGAGGSNPTLGWDDVSRFAPGRCIDPVLEPSEDPTPAPGPGPGQPAPSPVPPTPGPAPGTDLGPVMAKLNSIEARLIALESRPPEPAPTPGLDPAIAAYIDAMIGEGPGGGALNHITDIKTRLDIIRAGQEQLTAWLRSRAILRY